MQNVSHISTNFCIHFIQNLAAIVLLILYRKCIQKFVEMWYTFCIHFIYILHTSVVYILHYFCIQNVYTVSVWDSNGLSNWMNSLTIFWSVSIFSAFGLFDMRLANKTCCTQSLGVL